MATIYLTEQGTTVRKEQNRLVIEAEFHSSHDESRTTLRRSLYEQAHAVRRSLMRGIPYRAFTGWR